MRHGDLVVVHVDDARARGGVLGDLVDVPLGGDARADVEELADARLAGQEADGPAEEGPVGAHDGPRVGLDRDQGAGGVLVGPEVVVAA